MPPIQYVTIPNDFPIYNQSHEINVAVEGDHHVIKVNGEGILGFHDNTLSSGMVDFRSWGNLKAIFQNTTVIEIN